MLSLRVNIFAALKIFSKVSILITETLIQASCYFTGCCSHTQPYTRVTTFPNKSLSKMQHLSANASRTKFCQHKYIFNIWTRDTQLTCNMLISRTVPSEQGMTHWLSLVPCDKINRFTSLLAQKTFGMLRCSTFWKTSFK